MDEPLESAGLEDVDGMYERACDLADADQHAEAKGLFRQAAAAGYAPAWLALGNSLNALGRPDEAVVAFRAGVDAGDLDAHLNLALTLERQEDWAAAEVAYRQAQRAGEPRAVIGLADLWRWHGDPAAAKDLLQDAVSVDVDPYAAGYLGTWLHLDDLDADVEALLRQGADVDDDARSSLAWILRRRGELDEAERLLREGVRAGHEDSGIKLAVLLTEDRDDLAGAEQVL